MSRPTLTVTSDFTDQFNDLVDRFRNDRVLVGVPEQETTRKNNEGETPQINNATLLAINEFGSPVNNIPARPVMTIGITNAQDAIAKQFELAAVSGLQNGVADLDIYYERAGIIASNSIKKAINAQEGFPKPSRSTLASRKARGFKGTKSLIVTGQLRNSITYVVKGKT